MRQTQGCPPNIRSASSRAALVLIASAAVTSCTSPESAIRCGTPQTHALGGDASIVVRLALDQGDSIVRIEQIDTDVEAALDEGESTAFVNLPTWRDGTERMVVSQDRPGEAVLKIRSTESVGHAGRVGVVVCRLRGDDGRAAKRLEAERVMQLGARLARSGTRPGAVRAEQEFERAQRAFTSIRAARDAAWALYARGMLAYYPIEDNARAVSLLLAASQQLRDVGDAAAAANALARAGGAELTMAASLRTGGEHDRVRKRFELARDHLRRAMTEHAHLQRPYDRALAQNDVGISFQYEGRFDAAVAEYSQALEVFRSLGEVRRELMARQNLAAAAFEAGRFPEALRRYAEIEPMARQSSDAEQLLDILSNTAVIYSVTNHASDALTRYEEALSLPVCARQPSCVAKIHSGVADVYVRLGQPARALAFYKEALRIRKEGADRRALLATLTSMGNVQRQLGHVVEAESLHRQALEVAQSDHERQKARLAVALDCVAAARLACARDGLAEVIVSDLPEEHPLRARALEEQGALLAGSGESGRALELLARASAKFAGLGSPGDVARVEYRAARIARDAGNAAEALRRVKRAIEHIDAVRGRIATPAVRAQFLADAYEPHDLHVELLLSSTPVDKPSPIDALLASDAARARFILEALPTGDDGNVTRRVRDDLYSELAGLRLQQDRLLEKAEPSPADVRRLEELRLGLDQLRNRLDVLEGRASGPGRVLSQAASGAPAIEGWRRALPPHRKVVEYFLGERGSAVWILSADSVELHRLPPREEIEKLARALRGRLTRPPVTPKDESWKPAAARLRALLLDPIAPRLADAEVLVVPHRALFGVPFEVLLASQSAYQARFFYAPSIESQTLLESRSAPAQPTRSVAVIADPVFSRSDERFSVRGAELRQTTRIALLRAVGDASGELSRLPGTSAEAQRIFELAPKDTTLLQGFDASRERVLAPELDTFRILHFATHAVADAHDPQLSAIALSAFDHNGAPLDGWLRMYELRDRRLRAQLVVLSACESGLGQFYSGEGFVGLTHGFLAAGAQHVVASLWPVPDEATAQFMAEFYRRLLGEQRDVATALAHARQHLAASAHWQHPFYWAPFIVTGAPD